MLLGAALAFFHIIETGAGFTIVPKAGFTFVDTFISVEDVVQRYNNRSFAEELRGDSQMDNLVRNLEKQGFISTSKKSDSNSQSTEDPSTMVPAQHPQVATLPTPIAPSEKVDAPPKAISDNFDDDTVAELLSILSNFAVYCPGEGACEAKGFRLEPIDVNADGKNEFVVSNGGYCGSRGCTTLLMAEATDKAWVPLAGTFGNLNVMTVSTKGYRDIQHTLKIYPPNGPWYVAAQKFSWSGREYVANGKLEPLP